MKNNYKFAKYLFWFSLITLPFFFLPITMEFYNFNKVSLLYLTSIIALCGWLSITIINRSFYINLSINDLFLSLFVVSLTILNLITSPTVASIFSPSGPVLYWICLFLYFFYKSNYENVNKKIVLLSIALSGGIVGIIQLIWLFDLQKHFLNLPFWIKEITWSPTGHVTSTQSIVIFSTIISGIFLFIKIHKFLLKNISINNEIDFEKAIKDKKILLHTLLFAVLICSTASIFYLSSDLTPDKLQNVSYKDGWYILASSQRDFSTSLQGSGANNFQRIFSLNRPSQYSIFELSKKFPEYQSNYIFQLISDYGLIPTIILLLLILKILFRINNTSEESNKIVGIVIVSLGIIFFFFPLNITLIYIFFVMVYLYNVSFSKFATSKFSLPLEFRQIAIIACLALLVFQVFVFSKYYLADYYLRSSVNSQLQGINSTTYDLVFKSIAQNPYNPESRHFLALISESSYKTIINDANFKKDSTLKNKSVKLINQAIREEKNAISLHPNNPEYISSLALIYRNIVRTNPKQYLPTSSDLIKNALLNDPRNTSLRYEFAIFHAENGFFLDSINELKNTINLDPTFAVAYYNLYLLNRKIGNDIEAYNILQLLVSNLNPSDNQYDKLTKELKDFGDNIQNSSNSGKLKNIQSSPSSSTNKND